MDGTEHDISNFSSPLSHRLPTISASEALQNAPKRSGGITTSLPSLDHELRSVNPTADSGGGIQRSQLVEIYGPPGVGKTTFALQLAVNTIHSPDPQSHVVWIDTGSPLMPRRFRALMAAYTSTSDQELPSSPPEAQLRKQMLDKMSYFTANSLPRLLTLFLHPTALFPPLNTALIIIDSLSSLISRAYPRPSKPKAQSGLLRDKLAQKVASRKWAVVSEVAAAMARMAALHGIAVVALNQTVTSVKGGRKAVLKSALSAQGWDASVRTRLLLYRDFSPADLAKSLPQSERRGLRFAQVVKSGGREVKGRGRTVFVIERGGLKEMTRKVATGQPESSILPVRHLPEVAAAPLSPQQRPAKRKAAEIADSEDEDGCFGSDNEFGVLDDDDFEPEAEALGVAAAQADGQ